MDIKKCVKKLLKELNNDTSINGLTYYVSKIEWRIVYFNTPTGDNLLNTLKIEIPKEKDGFIYKSKRIIFINNDLSEAKKAVTVIHELAHIILKHEHSIKSDIEKELEAQAFTYYLIKKVKKWEKK